MYIRETLTRRTANNTYRSVRLVEGRRVGRKVQQKTLLNLGTGFSIPKAQWPELLKSLSQSLPGMNTSSSPPPNWRQLRRALCRDCEAASWRSPRMSRWMAIPRTLNGSDSHAYNVVLINFFQNSVMCDSLVVIRELLKRDRNYQIFFMKILWQRFFRGIRESFLPRM